MVASGGNLIDFHSISNVIPSSLIDLVVVLNTNNTVLYDRLAERYSAAMGQLKFRGYSAHKIRGNIECEIMQVLLEEAHEVFQEAPNVPILNLRSDSEADQNENVQRLKTILNIN